ncbi:MBL fold metallo-hydrolase [Pontibacter silvestris]|uniref:MBL fold metallo-hydrolase n=1 Tax=Pontibacter silvestris TaxID=2305183 RepID=A0ABW4WZ90_9BACT|nr:MBL fold metallo-hydrolase [Pontibacter silvestris]MCC9136849.1 MBL fold metallo-hydrolase [Pontibacter silvestris]
MNIKFLGTGGAFDTEYLNSAAILEFRDIKLLIDCGFTVFPKLIEKNLVHEIDHVILTHLHNDHSGSLANLLLYKSIILKNDRLKILYTSEQFKQQIYDLLAIQLKYPDKYAEFVPLDQFDGIMAVDTFGLHSEGYQSYAYIFDNDYRIVYSGDLGKPEELFNRLERLPQKETCVFHDITFSPDNTGHTYYKKLLPYINGITMYGYHCDPTQNPDDNPIRLVFFQQNLMA